MQLIVTINVLFTMFRLNLESFDTIEMLMYRTTPREQKLAPDVSEKMRAQVGPTPTSPSLGIGLQGTIATSVQRPIKSDHSRPAPEHINRLRGRTLHSRHSPGRTNPGPQSRVSKQSFTIKLVDTKIEKYLSETYAQ